MSGKALGYLLVGIGGGWLLAGALMLKYRIRFIRSTIRVAGTVVDENMARGLQQPIIAYEVANRSYTLKTIGIYQRVVSSGIRRQYLPIIKKGDVFYVRYEPNDPSIARADSYVETWGVVVAMLVIGVPFAAAGLMLLVS